MATQIDGSTLMTRPRINISGAPKVEGSLVQCSQVTQLRMETMLLSIERIVGHCLSGGPRGTHVKRLFFFR